MVFLGNNHLYLHISDESLAEAIAANEDLLIEILLRLPVKSLMRFKCVSKHWFSLISSSLFSCSHSSRVSNRLISGVFLNNPPLYVSLLDESQSCGLSFPFFAFLNSPSVEVMNSCNGLVLLCSSLTTTFYVCNPTTKQYRTLAKPLGSSLTKSIAGMSLVFDPSQSAHFKVICVWNTKMQNQMEINVGFSMMGTYQIEIFSSKTNLWCVSSHCFTALVGTQFHHGVFWNGTVYWFTPKDWLLSYDVENDLLKSMATPPMDYRRCGNFPYLGVSNGRLHLVYIHIPNNSEFDVLEMERDNSGWATRYRVNIDNVATTFPESVIYIPGLPKRLKIFAYTVLSIVRGDREEELIVVLSIMGKIISYDVKNKTLKLLCDVKKALGHWKVDCNGLYAHPCIESLSWA